MAGGPRPSDGTSCEALIPQRAEGYRALIISNDEGSLHTHSLKPPTANRNRKLLLILLLIGLLALAGCGRDPLQKSPIVVFGSPDSPRLRQAVAGFTGQV